MDNFTEPLKFGSKAWLANAIVLKFQDTPERPAHKLLTVSDYLNLQKLERLLWPDEIPKKRFIWIDPPDYPTELETLPVPGVTSK